MARPGDRIDGYFLVADAQDTPRDADALPAVAIRRNGETDHAATVSNLSVGEYYYYFDVPAEWLAGDLLAAVIDVVIDGTAYQSAGSDWELEYSLQPPADTCDLREVVRPEIARMEKPVPQRRQAVRVLQGQTAVVEVVFRYDSGRHFDLSTYLANGTTMNPGSSSSTPDSCSAHDSTHNYRLVVKFKEPFAPAGEATVETTGYAHDAAKGVVRYVLPEAAVLESQIQYAFIGLYDTTRLIHGMETYVCVDRSPFSALGYRRVGVPTTAEVRGRLRDSGKDDNYLLARIEHSLDEVAEAEVKAVSQWNTWFTNAGLGDFTTKNFPDPDNLMDAVMSYLYEMLADNYRRNHLEYQAAGVTVNDKDYGNIYDQLAAQYGALADKTARRQAAATSRRGWGTIVNSPYSYRRSNGGWY